MSKIDLSEQQVAFVFGTLPELAELDQIALLATVCHVSVITPASMSAYIKENFQPVLIPRANACRSVSILELPDHSDQLSFLPGLESVLSKFSVVIVKERLGMYAFQAVKAKQQHHFRLYYWIDNGFSFPAEDIETLRTIREEATRLADGFIVQSRTTEQALCAEGIHSERIIHWPVWVNISAYHVGQTVLDGFLCHEAIDRGHFMITHFGQLEWEEGIGLLLDALAFLKRESPRVSDRVKLVFCGLGSYSSVLQSRANRLGIDSQVKLVFPNRENISILLERSDAAHFGGRVSRDRIETHKGLVWLAMAKRNKIILPRSGIGEETVEKHRFDYCAGSSLSLSKAIKKSIQSVQLGVDIVDKNQAKFKVNDDRDSCLEKMSRSLESSRSQISDTPTGSYEKIVYQIEEAISRGQYAEASVQIEDILNSSISLKEYQKAEMYRLIGDCFTKLSDVDAGKQAYIQACELDPYSAKGHIGLGTVSLIKGQHEIAIVQFQKSISLAPKDEMANLGLGLSFSGLEEYKEAKKWVEAAIELNPDNSAAIYSLVRISHELEDYSSVQKALEDFILRHPMDSHMQYTYCGILFETKQYSKVVEILSEQLKVSPMDIRGQTLLRQSKRALQKEQDSKQALPSSI